MLKEMEVENIGVNTVTYKRAVILHEIEGGRHLVIWIGPVEADAIVICLRGITVQRPLTHDLLFSAIKTLNAAVKAVEITRLERDTFFAKVVLSCEYENDETETFELDARPSDAIALALRANAPIFADEQVLEQAGIAPQGESTTSGPAVTQEPRSRITPEEAKKLEPFRECIEGLDLPDDDPPKR